MAARERRREALIAESAQVYEQLVAVADRLERYTADLRTEVARRQQERERRNA